ncbi:MAG: HAMP domain-containing histidine kinase [Lachnospiraceae bacterium]|nr:HAMP domain-containing histidine kinase [Lachnospiraceae bacterium]
MKKTLFLKFILAYVIFAFFGFIVIATFSASLIDQRVTSENAQSLYTEASMISKTYASDLYNNEITIESASHQLRALGAYLSSSIWIVNPSGTVLVSSLSFPDLENPEVIPDFSPSITKDSYYTTGNFFGKSSEETLMVFSPITSNYKIKGYVVIVKPLRHLAKESNGYLAIMYITLVLLILLSLIILIFFAEIIYIPLKKIIHATEQYADGNMHYEFSVDTNDEMGYLAGTLNYMASEIARSEDHQKKFVANVSHDFRSPLTSIRGYLEAMLDGTIPAQMHEKYLKIVLNETDRLTKLTNSLLQLNNLNTKGMILEKTDFDMNTVIRDTVATFEGLCEKKNIHVALILVGETMMVNGDMSKLQQVLYNLIDNAIKFSHNNSTITIETREKKSKLCISVKDTGIGIPKDSQKLIFDRFYKTDLSRGKDKKGTGLGLAITKEIIHSHGENINVISTEGVGTEFIFTVPITESEDDE